MTILSPDRPEIRTAMNNPRIYGRARFTVAVIHGGQGAPGEMAAVARELATTRGISEPLQTASTVDGQIQELKKYWTRL